MYKYTKIIKYILIFSMMLIFIYPISALHMGPYSSNTPAKIRDIHQLNTLDKNGILYSEVLFEMYLDKDDLLPESNYILNVPFWWSESWQNNGFKKFDGVICDGFSLKGHNFSNFKMQCNNIIKPEISENQVVKFNLSKLHYKSFALKINYTSLKPVSIKLNKWQYLLWLRLTCASGKCNNMSIDRNLKLPAKNIVIEEKDNWEYEYVTSNLNIVLKSKGVGESLLWYRDVRDENHERNLGLVIGALFSLLGSVIILFLQISRVIDRFHIKIRIILIIGFVFLFLCFLCRLLDFITNKYFWFIAWVGIVIIILFIFEFNRTRLNISIKSKTIIANLATRKYHKKSCRYAKKSSGRYFKNEHLAKNAGYEPCKVCYKQK